MGSNIEPHEPEVVSSDPIISSFIDSQSEWLDEPVLNTWKTDPSKLEVIQHVSNLYKEWSTIRSGPFSPYEDPLWLDTAKIMRDAGLPWHTNNVNMPEHIDKSWPLHFRNFERHAILAKGARVGCPDVTGYISSWEETNQYGIRALQQELRHKFPGVKPILAGGNIDAELFDSSAQLFGLETMRMGLDWNRGRETLIQLSGRTRPVIFAATLGNLRGQVDDFDIIKSLGKDIPLLVHLDASRTFEYVTTASTQDRKLYKIPQLFLRHPFNDRDKEEPTGNSIVAATIVAGGTNCVSPPMTAILKPQKLGDSSEIQIEYIRGKDSTLSGSRDGVGPLLNSLQELRFGLSGLREIFARCSQNRAALNTILTEHGLNIRAPASSLDIILCGRQIPPFICEKWGIELVSAENYLLTVQPSATNSDFQDLLKDITNWDYSGLHQFRTVMVPHIDLARCRIQKQFLKLTVENFRSVGPYSSGYPLNMASYTALGPVIGNFLPIHFPSKWIDDRAQEILAGRKISFGLLEDHSSFPGCFTTGSTMGNRVGIHTALAQYPNAFVYYSSSTHYSVGKIARDCDAFTRIWDTEHRTRFVQIPADDLGCMISDELVKKALEDKFYCKSKGEEYQVILFCNVGTTFVGGRDNILELQQKLVLNMMDVSYIHVDGALDLGFGSDSVVLGPPGLISRGGRPVVQGITLSHHKAYGIMVSGEVICHNPTGELVPEPTAIDPRAVFETWLFQSMYSPKDLLRIRQYCLSNSNRLRSALAEAGFMTRYNDDSCITLLERIPSWLIKEFNLAPEGNRLHYITMPHITPGAVDSFVAKISEIDVHFRCMFETMRENLTSIFGCQVHLIRLRARDVELISKIAILATQGLKDIQNEAAYDWVKQKYIHSTMSFAAISCQNSSEPLVAFLASADAKRNLIPGPVLTTVPVGDGLDIELLEALGGTGFKWLADSLDLNVIC